MTRWLVLLALLALASCVIPLPGEASTRVQLATFARDVTDAVRKERAKKKARPPSVEQESMPASRGLFRLEYT